ncbi:hypothetical protein D3C85_1648900 [compost metagenome]
MEVLQWSAQVRRAAQIAKPDARLFCQLFDIGPAVAGEGEGDVEDTALTVEPWLTQA